MKRGWEEREKERKREKGGGKSGVLGRGWIMPPNNRWHYELLMQTVSRIRARNRVRVEEASYSPCSLLPFSPFESGPFFFRPRGWPRIQRDTSNEASFNSFNSTDLQRLVPFPLPLLLFFQKRATFRREQQSRAARWLTRGPVDLFMANWKRKLRPTIGSLSRPHTKLSS